KATYWYSLIESGLLLLNLHNRFHFHAGPQWQGRQADCAAAVPTGVAEDVDEQLRGAVDDQVLLGEVKIAVDEAGQFQEALDPVERAEFLLEQAQQIDRALGGGLF